MSPTQSARLMSRVSGAFYPARVVLRFSSVLWLTEWLTAFHITDIVHRSVFIEFCASFFLFVLVSMSVNMKLVTQHSGCWLLCVDATSIRIFLHLSIHSSSVLTLQTGNKYYEVGVRFVHNEGLIYWNTLQQSRTDCCCVFQLQWLIYVSTI